MPGFTTHPLTPPIFHFPPEKKLELTGQDLISILRYCQLLPGYTPPPREQTRAQYCADALDHVAFSPGRKRMIFRQWPRPPEGVMITPKSTLPGMTIPNTIGQLWGETMFDFYRTYRICDMNNFITLTTGSKMMSFAKANDGVEVAKREIQWAETENKPRRLEPYSKKALERQEQHLRLGHSGESSRNRDNVGTRDSSAPVDIFHESNLPPPWPFVPFSYQPEPLQTRIPLHRLPKTITVHDPWKVLTIYDQEDQAKDAHWSSRPDLTYTYRLQLTMAGKRKVSEELAALNSPNSIQEETTAKQEGYFLNPSDVEGPRAPAVWIEPPPRPSPKDTQTPHDSSKHAHLYLSPSHKLGKGSHSVVYKAEWDLPRSLLFGDDIPDLVHCQECGKADARTHLKEIDGEHGERMDMKWKTPSAYNRKVVSKTPPFTMTLQNPRSGELLDVVTCPGSTETRYEYEGDRRTVHTSVGWQDPRNPTCPHIKPTSIPPPFARVRVAAKLSLQHDTHLVHEAGNYQMFEQHMFEHWNGLSLVQPCHDPVPNGPIVPQFYGYYVPEDEHKRLDDDTYLSPILLLELCGRQVNEDDLTEDEKSEAASLFYRFHREGWTHNSPFRRNVVCQYGPLHVPHYRRHTERSKRQLSFRLIDFGRSEFKISLKDKIHEPNEDDEEVRSLFGDYLFNLL